VSRQGAAARRGKGVRDDGGGIGGSGGRAEKVWSFKFAIKFATGFAIKFAKVSTIGPFLSGLLAGFQRCGRRIPAIVAYN
jgi:hypothetical protein